MFHDKQTRKRKSSKTEYSANSITYHGINIYQAAGQGNLPLCVLLWGMASAKKTPLITPDEEGNNPMHFASFAETPEVLNFFMQQSKGMLSDEIRLVESKNKNGETPLLRTMITGSISVAKALLEEQSDPFVVDNFGNNIFIVLAKCGHLWCLNFVYHYVSHLYGQEATSTLMAALDREGHSALDWAADSGNVNVIEFFIRKGLNPFRVDSLNRSPLFWAVKSNKIAASRFLALCGCDPFQRSTDNKSTHLLAIESKDKEMLKVLSVKLSNDTLRNDGNNSLNDVQTATILDASMAPRLYDNGRNWFCSSRSALNYDRPMISHARYRSETSRLSHATAYGLIVFFIWVIAIYTPFYLWFIIICISFAIFRYYETQIGKEIQKGNIARLNDFQKFFIAPEKGLGLWIGVMTIFFLFLIANILYKDYDQNDREYHDFSSFQDEMTTYFFDQILNIKALSAGSQDRGLFWLTFLFTIQSMFLWCHVAWIETDPGIVDTRENDFDEIMNHSLTHLEVPSPSIYCRTSLVKKPIRSKYCPHMAGVVARMDHYCVWLNITIGFGNHRIFILFLFYTFCTALLSVILISRTLQREISSTPDCSAMDTVLGKHYFVVVLMDAVMFIATLAIGALLCEQLYNVANNMTINERINGARYPWMVDSEGNPCNLFDRGYCQNILEFWRVPKYHVDYMSVFVLPSRNVNASTKDYTLDGDKSNRLSNVPDPCDHLQPSSEDEENQSSTSHTHNNSSSQGNNVQQSYSRMFNNNSTKQDNERRPPRNSNSSFASTVSSVDNAPSMPNKMQSYTALNGSHTSGSGGGGSSMPNMVFSNSMIDRYTSLKRDLSLSSSSTVSNVQMDASSSVSTVPSLFNPEATDDNQSRRKPSQLPPIYPQDEGNNNSMMANWNAPRERRSNSLNFIGSQPAGISSSQQQLINIGNLSSMTRNHSSSLVSLPRNSHQLFMDRGGTIASSPTTDTPHITTNPSSRFGITREVLMLENRMDAD